MSLAAVLLS